MVPSILKSPFVRCLSIRIRFSDLPLLTHKDSNLECLNQNQMCYHYTMGQFPLKKGLQKYK